MSVKITMDDIKTLEYFLNKNPKTEDRLSLYAAFVKGFKRRIKAYEAFSEAQPERVKVWDEELEKWITYKKM